MSTHHPCLQHAGCADLSNESKPWPSHHKPAHVTHSRPDLRNRAREATGPPAPSSLGADHAVDSCAGRTSRRPPAGGSHPCCRMRWRFEWSHPAAATAATTRPGGDRHAGPDDARSGPAIRGATHGRRTRCGRYRAERPDVGSIFCGLTAAGEAWCWGRGATGQVGDGGVVDQVVPTRVATTVRFTAISVGVDHTCALAQDQTAWCWGSRGLTGSALLGLPVNVTTPIQVFGGRKYTEVSAGGRHTCARAADGTWCWGFTNSFGELGKGGGNVGAGINMTPFKVRFP